LCIGTFEDVPIGIGTEIHFLSNSIKLINVLDNWKLDVHRTYVLICFKMNLKVLVCSKLCWSISLFGSTRYRLVPILNSSKSSIFHRFYTFSRYPSGLKARLAWARASGSLSWILLKHDINYSAKYRFVSISNSQRLLTKIEFVYSIDVPQA
jgi:hypothetical protein